MAKKRKISFEIKTEVDMSIVEKLNNLEKKIVKETLKFLNSSEVEEIKKGYETDTPRETNFGSRKILYVEDMPCDKKETGFSLFGDDGFVFFCRAFENKEQFIRTTLHEFHRLHSSKIREKEFCQEDVTMETQEAHSFCDTIYSKIFKN